MNREEEGWWGMVCMGWGGMGGGRRKRDVPRETFYKSDSFLLRACFSTTRHNLNTATE